MDAKIPADSRTNRAARSYNDSMEPDKPFPSRFTALIEGLSACSWVESLALGGSRASGSADAGSDFDLYVYVNSEPVLLDRERICLEAFTRFELDNRYWETEDDGVLKGESGLKGLPVDIIYRSMDWLEAEMEALLVNHRASLGYTTCLWANLLESRILFDRNGHFAGLQKRWDIAYPPELRDAIIQKNLPLLERGLPNYRDQILKAASRADWIAVNHRSSAWIASYMDVVLAALGLKHPGEKRLLQWLGSCGREVPEEMANDLLALLEASASPGSMSHDPAGAGREAAGRLGQVLGLLNRNLESWLSGQGFQR